MSAAPCRSRHRQPVAWHGARSARSGSWRHRLCCPLALRKPVQLDGRFTAGRERLVAEAVTAELDDLGNGLVMGAARRRDRDDVRPASLQCLPPVGTRTGDGQPGGDLGDDTRRPADDPHDLGAGAAECVSVALSRKSGSSNQDFQLAIHRFARQVGVSIHSAVPGTLASLFLEAPALSTARRSARTRQALGKSASPSRHRS